VREEVFNEAAFPFPSLSVSEKIRSDQIRSDQIRDFYLLNLGRVC
jgi:hypothetical protein